MRPKLAYKKSKKRIGRGIGSGHGKTSTRGHKGQRARSGAGARIRPGFEGGQNPLYRRLPKRGFNNAAFQEDLAIVNLEKIEALGLTEVSPEILKEHGLIRKSGDKVKILGNGTLSKSVTIKAHQFSDSAKQKIEKAKGTVVVLQ
ncbi:MAG: 50S ribosomal protein L15 [Omnitrophica bacterium GWA2_52_12]|nr:MAG: 50S ribosomal protein L15 [Omnitrophica bacterium GWA2_52_12]